MRTYPSRPMLTTESEVALAAYGLRYSRAERCLFSHLCAGEDAGKLKSSFMREHDLTARQFNALAFSVKGKIKSLIEGRNQLIAELKERISWLEYRLSEKLEPGTNKYHQKRRKLAALRGRLAGLEQDQKSGRVRIASGAAGSCARSSTLQRTATGIMPHGSATGRMRGRARSSSSVRRMKRPVARDASWCLLEMDCSR